MTIARPLSDPPNPRTRLASAPPVALSSASPVRLSAAARQVADNVDHVPIRGLRGPAGCGKSFALAARAARLAAVGKRVLVLSFNMTLAARLRRLVEERCEELDADVDGVTCTNFHSWCASVVDDAARSGITVDEPDRGTWPEKIVQRAESAFVAGHHRPFDAVLVDEGQDFTPQWWDLLRRHAVVPGGEMLLAIDPTVDLYRQASWDDPAQLDAAGFAEPWIEMDGCYRMAPELVESTNRFAMSFLGGDAVVPVVPHDQVDVVGHIASAARSWVNIDRVADLGTAIGREVVRLLDDHESLSPADIVYICEYHHDGLAAAAAIEAAGFPVHHVYSRNPDERHQRKREFDPRSPAVKGCTVHSFKGWEIPAVVLGIGMEDRSRRLAYASMTRVSSTTGVAESALVVVNADPRIADFGASFELAMPQLEH